jgi:hypothetical protein
MYRKIGINDRDWDESLEGVKYIGRTMGCGCCASWEKLTPESLALHIAALEEELALARQIQADIPNLEP